MAKILTIEIDTAQIRVAEVDSRGQHIYRCFVLPVPQGAVDDGQIRDTKSLGKLLKEELIAQGIKTRKVFFVAGSSRIASREVRIPFVKKDRIQSIIQENATDYFPIDISSYVISYSIIDIESKEQETGGAIRQYHLMVYAAPTSISAAFREFAEVAGLNMTGIGFTGDSVYSAVKTTFSDGLHMLVKIEFDSTSISIIKDGDLALQRNINYGVDSAIETVRAFPQFGENLSQQEALMVLHDRRCLKDSLNGIDTSDMDIQDQLLENAKMEVTESFRYMVGNISRIMDYYISRNTDATFSSIQICGLGAGIKGVRRLLANELAQKVEVVYALDKCTYPEFSEEEGLYLYTAVIAPMRSGVNLMEKTTRKKKENKDSLSGAVLICVVGVAAGVALTAAGVASRVYQQHQQDYLNQRINEESSIEEIYNAYNTAQEQYQNYQNMYQYTNTPNEGLKAFLEEMEQKMPSDITLDTFSSDGSQVSFSMRVSGKSAAANTLMQLRTFESLATVTTTGLEEDETGTVAMSVICTYANPAPLDNTEE